MILHTVLRRSHEYDYDYVERMAANLRRLNLDVDIHCLHDEVETAPAIDRVTFVPMLHKLPGWFAKFNLFYQCTEGFVYVDLDTVFTDDISWLWRLEHSHLLSDLYKPALAQSGVMQFTGWGAQHVQGIIAAYGFQYIQKEFRGDGEFLHWAVGHKFARLQDAAPGAIVSYKAARVAERGVPEGASIVCFHGQPRPRSVGWKV